MAITHRNPGSLVGRRGRIRLLTVVVALISGSVNAGDSVPPLKFDPFRAKEPATAVSSERVRKAPEAEFRPILVSTIVGNRRSTANLGGVLLAVGEEAHGYRLLEVRSFEAVFERKGERIILEVDQGEAGAR